MKLTKFTLLRRRIVRGCLVLACCLAWPAGQLVAEPMDIDAGWLEIEGEDLSLMTNAGRQRGLEIAAALHQFRAVFARLAPAIELSSPAPTTLLAFRDHRSYAPFKTVADRGNSRILGQFLSKPDGNYLTIDAGAELVGSLAVIYHEYVHYFVRNNFPGVPLWFNEGLAEFYSTLTQEEDAVLIGGAVERHLDHLRRRGELDLVSLLEADSRSESYHAPNKVGDFYAQSWLLVHYLLSGSGERLERAADFFSRVQEGEDAISGFEEAFDLRLSTLEEELQRHLVEGDFTAVRVPLADLGSGSWRVRPLSAADTNVHLADLLLHIDRRREAESFLQRALDLQPQHGDALAVMARSRDMGNRFDEAGILYQEALAIGSNRPQTYLHYGIHLLHVAHHRSPSEGGDPEGETRHGQTTDGDTPGARRQRLIEGAREVLREAIDLKGDYGEAWYMLGQSHSLEGGDPAAGLVALQKAHALLPARLEVVAALALTHARMGQRGDAEMLIDGLLRPRGELEMVVQVEDEVERLLLLRASRLAFENEDYATAIDLFDRAIDYTRDNDLRRRLEADLLRMQERYR